MRASIGISAMLGLIVAWGAALPCVAASNDMIKALPPSVDSVSCMDVAALRGHTAVLAIVMDTMDGACSGPFGDLPEGWMKKMGIDPAKNLDSIIIGAANAQATTATPAPMTAILTGIFDADQLTKAESVLKDDGCKIKRDTYKNVTVLSARRKKSSPDIFCALVGPSLLIGNSRPLMEQTIDRLQSPGSGGEGALGNPKLAALLKDTDIKAPVWIAGQAPEQGFSAQKNPFQASISIGAGGGGGGFGGGGGGVHFSKSFSTSIKSNTAVSSASATTLPMITIGGDKDDDATSDPLGAVGAVAIAVQAGGTNMNQQNSVIKFSGQKSSVISISSSANGARSSFVSLNPQDPASILPNLKGLKEYTLSCDAESGANAKATLFFENQESATQAKSILKTCRSMFGSTLINLKFDNDDDNTAHNDPATSSAKSTKDERASLTDLLNKVKIQTEDKKLTATWNLTEEDARDLREAFKNPVENKGAAIFARKALIRTKAPAADTPESAPGKPASAAPPAGF
ncbi:MAG: hypothetical protein NTX50_16540 [Candidatus Sumerlaeota bacterium]|nr:hypothetical protein [Candidatus Sumerlaeota bacterium]